VAGERIVRELLQDEAEPGLIAAEIGRILTDDVYAREMRQKLAGVKSKLGAGGGSARVARLLIEMVTDSTETQ